MTTEVRGEATAGPALQFQFVPSKIYMKNFAKTNKFNNMKKYLSQQNNFNFEFYNLRNFLEGFSIFPGYVWTVNYETKNLK